MRGTAIRMLISDRGKLATALIGVIFSVLLVNVQGGLFIGLIDKAGLLVDNGQGRYLGRTHRIDVISRGL